MAGSISRRGLADFAATAVSQDEELVRLAAALTTVVDPPIREAADGELRARAPTETQSFGGATFVPGACNQRHLSLPGDANRVGYSSNDRQAQVA